MSAQIKANSPLLALPAELRNQIYDLALIQAQPIRLSYNDALRVGHNRQPAHAELATRMRQPPLTRACRQIRSEPLKTFYGNNMFTVCTYFELFPTAN